MSNDHARVAPSGFHLTVPCPASLQLQEQVPPQPETEELAEGTAAHHAASECLRGRPMAVGAAFESGGRTWTVDADMQDGAELWADTMGPGCEIESPVHITAVHPLCWGTPDAWRYDPAARRLVVGDYKYGHRYVDPFENLQLSGYAAGVLAQLGISPADDSTVVELVIVQPRAFHRGGPVQRWTTTPKRLADVVARINRAAYEAVGDHPIATTGPHCTDCRARAVCGTLRAAAANVVDFSGTIEPHGIDTAAACTELVILDEAAARLEARRTGLAAQVEAAARNGERTPGWALEPGSAKLEWLSTVTVDEVRAFGAAMGVDLTKPPALITPTQAVKRLATTEANMLAFAERKPGGVRLKRDTGETARRVFGV